MKSLKKTLVLLVVFSMILSAVMPAFAATDIYGLDCEEEVARLEALKVVTGYEDGTFGPEKTITRAEMAVILCKMVGIDTVTVDENKNVPSKFSDVAAGEWYTGYINVAAGKGLLSGFPDGTFRPNEQLTMNQVLTLCVNALGRGEYVAEMGTWPANYIAEATKLGLLDGVKTSDANRGNVAIIVWNTLEAPYVWDVTNTEYEGSINLGNSTRSLLSIYFRDYVFTKLSDDDQVIAYPLKEVEYMTVSQVPATNGELGEKQIQLIPEDQYANGFAAAFDKTAPRRTDDTEWTTIDENGDVITAYAPSFDNLDSYYGKVVTVIFGKDNEVVSIRVVDETVEDEYLTAYDVSSSVSNFTIGGTKYKFADHAYVYANTIEQTDYASKTAVAAGDTDADEALAAFFDKLDIDPEDDKYDDYTKVIKASVSLNNKGKVTRLDLFVSGTYDIPELKTVEAVVTKVRNEKLTLQYTVADAVKELTYDYSELDEDELPRVIKDGTVSSIDEVEVGNVLTYYYGTDIKDLKTVYVSSNIVSGEVTRAKKTDMRIYTDEGDYVPSMGVIFVTEDKLTEIDDVTDANSLVGENVELYLNIYGEYVLAVVEDIDNGDWKFGYIKDIKEFEQIEDKDDYEAKIRILLPDGSVSSRAYKIFADEEDINNAETYLETTVPGANFKDAQGNVVGFVAFKASSDTIDWDNIIFINEATGALTAQNNTIKNDFNADYEIVKLDDGFAVNDSRKRIYNHANVENATANYKFLSDSVIYNVDAKELGVSTKWGMLVDIDRSNGAKTLNANTLVIVEKDETDILYAIIDVEHAPSSDAMYATVKDDHTKVKEDNEYRYYLELIDEENADGTKIYAERDNDAEADVKAVSVDSFVEYVLSSDEIRTIKELVKLVKFADLDSDEAVTNAIVDDGEETDLAVTLVPGTTTPERLAQHGTVATCTGTCTTASHNGHGDAIKWDGCAEEVGATECTNETHNHDGKNVIAWESCTQTAACPNDADDHATECDDCTLVRTYAAAVTTVGTVKANFKVVYTEDDLIEYEDDENEVEAGTKFGELEIDEDAIIYDVRDGFKTITFKELADEVAKDGYVYVIPFANNDCEPGTDANILVVVD